MTHKKKGDADKVFHVGVTAKSSAEGHYTVFVGDIAIGVFYFADDEADIKLEQLIKANADVIADAVIEQMLITYEVPKPPPVHLVKSDTSKKGQSVHLSNTLLSKNIIVKQTAPAPVQPIYSHNLSVTCDKCGDNATRSISIKGSTMNLCPICNIEKGAIIPNDEI